MRLIVRLTTVALPLALGACNTADRLSNIGATPALSAIQDPTAQPGYKPVRMPMPDVQPVSYAPNSLWRTGSRAFFKDQRAAKVGDVLTVNVIVTDKANISNETKRSRANTESFGLPNAVGLENTPAGKARELEAARSSAQPPQRPMTARARFSARNRSRPTWRRWLPRCFLTETSSLRANRKSASTSRCASSSWRRGPTGGHRRRQHHRFNEDRRGAHRLWRPRPDHRRAAAALRPATRRRPAAVLRRASQREPAQGCPQCSGPLGGGNADESVSS